MDVRAILFFSFLDSFVFSQKLDNQFLLRSFSSSDNIVVHYDNDLFVGRDEAYSQGFRLDWNTRILKKNPLNRLLVGSEKSASNYGMSLKHLVYTPAQLGAHEIQYGDQPYMANFSLQLYKSTLHQSDKMKTNSSITLGIMGPSAFGEAMQRKIHKAVGAIDPKGWNNQLSNSLIFNYSASVENELIRFRKLFALYTDIGAGLGNELTYLAGGASLIFGRLNSPFAEKDRFQCYFFSRPALDIVLYDSSLLGGGFSKELYSIKYSSMKKFVTAHHFGLIFSNKNVFLEFSITQQSESFKDAGSRLWGGVKFGIMY